MAKNTFQLLGSTKTRVIAQRDVWSDSKLELSPYLGFDTVVARLMDVKANLAAGVALSDAAMLLRD